MISYDLILRECHIRSFPFPANLSHLKYSYHEERNVFILWEFPNITALE